MTGVQTCALPISSVNDVAMSNNGIYQYALQNTASTIYTSQNTGISWSTLGSANGLPTGLQNYTSLSASADGKYVVTGTANGSLYTSANYGSMFSTIGMGTPNVYLPFNGTLTDVISGTTVTATGSPGYVPGFVGPQALYLNNSSPGGTAATQYEIGRAHV